MCDHFESFRFLQVLFDAAESIAAFGRFTFHCALDPLNLARIDTVYGEE